MSDPQRKAIFITGGASGIGRAVAVHFAARGWIVGLADVNEPGLAETERLLRGEAAATFRLDVRDPAHWEAALAAFVARTGRLDVLFNNAGIAHGGPLVDHSREQIADLLDVNLHGAIQGARAGYPHLKATPGSCLLNTCSAAAIYGAPGMAVYSVTKFGIRALTEALDIEWAADGIRVRDLMPGFVDTPLLAGPSAGSNVSKRQRVVDAGLAFTSLDEVASKAWEAVHGDRIHTPVGRMARQMGFAARWMPGKLRRQLRALSRVVA